MAQVSEAAAPLCSSTTESSSQLRTDHGSTTAMLHDSDRRIFQFDTFAVLFSISESFYSKKTICPFDLRGVSPSAALWGNTVSMHSLKKGRWYACLSNVTLGFPELHHKWSPLMENSYSHWQFCECQRLKEKVKAHSSNTVLCRPPNYPLSLHSPLGLHP